MVENLQSMTIVDRQGMVISATYSYIKGISYDFDPLIHYEIPKNSYLTLLYLPLLLQ